MIASCPACAARFRLDRLRLGGKRITLRCSRCREVFKIEVAGTPAGSSRVLVAHSDEALCSMIGEILSKEGLPFQICHTGQETLHSMEISPPQVAIVDVALPGLFAFELIEKIRNRPALKEVKILLLSSVYNKMAYKRRPSSLYGADDYIEKHHIPDDLIPKINRLITHAEPVSQNTESLQEEEVAGRELGKHEASVHSKEFVEEINTHIRSAEEREVEADASSVEEKARRLARIIVSDIALYNQDRVEEGIRTGRFHELLAGEIAEGRRLFAERVGSGAGLQEDFLGSAFASFLERRKKELQL